MHVQLIVPRCFHALRQEQDISGNKGISPGFHFDEIYVA